MRFVPWVVMIPPAPRNGRVTLGPMITPTPKWRIGRFDTDDRRSGRGAVRPKSACADATCNVELATVHQTRPAAIRLTLASGVRGEVTPSAKPRIGALLPCRILAATKRGREDNYVRTHGAVAYFSHEPLPKICGSACSSLTDRTCVTADRTLRHGDRTAAGRGGRRHAAGAWIQTTTIGCLFAADVKAEREQQETRRETDIDRWAAHFAIRCGKSETLPLAVP